MNYSRIVGWILLIAGILLIGWTLWSSYGIFTAKADLPEFFEMQEEAAVKEEPLTAEAQMEEMVREQLEGILPTDAITKLLNLTVWSLLAFILIMGGSQVSGLGIRLVRK
jgi:hypothetical protein